MTDARRSAAVLPSDSRPSALRCCLSMPDELAIHARGVTRVYKAKPDPVTALGGVDLNVQPGELFGLLGPNGAGKTTLVKILATLLLPTSGQARVLGCDVARETGKVREQIGLVFGGDRGFYSRLSVRDNLVYWSALYRLPRREAQQRAQAVLDLMQLGPVAERPVETLSRG